MRWSDWRRSRRVENTEEVRFTIDDLAGLMFYVEDSRSGNQLIHEALVARTISMLMKVDLTEPEIW